MTSERKYDLTDVKPQPGSRNGWTYKSWLCIGSAEIECKDGDINLYGIYGVRGDEVFAQYCGKRLADGSTLGVSLMSSSADMEGYVWSKAEWFHSMWIDGESVVSEVTAAGDAS